MMFLILVSIKDVQFTLSLPNPNQRRHQGGDRQVRTTPLLNVKKKKVSFNFQKKVLLE